MARRGVRQIDLKPVLALSQAAISDKYRGQTPWSLDDLERLADYLQVPIAELLVTPDYAGAGLPRLDSNQRPFVLRSAQVSDVQRDASTDDEGADTAAGADGDTTSARGALSLVARLPGGTSRPHARPSRPTGDSAALTESTVLTKLAAVLPFHRPTHHQTEESA